MKKFLKILFALLFVGFLFAELLVLPIIDIANKDDRKTLSIVYAVKILEVEHSVNYIIPFGKDYYYLGFDEDDNAYLIHAPKKWADNFSDSFDNTLEITALQKKISDYDISRELYSIAGSQEELTFPLGYSECLDLNYIKDAVMKIISGILALALAVIGIANYKKRAEIPSVARKIYALAIALTMLLMLVAIV
ncbi:MAG: hypothetical protein NC489_03230 [Ruminococcus flavefaciens]|nr:hypothetical protein [Ruminococcus flavefaciens]